MEKKHAFRALRATTLAALCAGGLMLFTTGCESNGGDKAAEKTCGGDKGCGDKGCGDKSGEKSCGDKSCGDKSGEKTCGK